jgi:hypothetical protein
MKVKPKHSMMPPIVSSANRSRSNSMPPIVSSAEATTIPPIVSSTQGSKTRVQTAVAETTQTVKAAAKKPLQMMPAIKSTVDATANATAKTFNNSSMLSPIRLPKSKRMSRSSPKRRPLLLILPSMRTFRLSLNGNSINSELQADLRAAYRTVASQSCQQVQ